MRKDIRTKIVDTLNERQLNRKNLAEYTGISQSTITKILGRFIELQRTPSLPCVKNST